MPKRKSKQLLLVEILSGFNLLKSNLTNHFGLISALKKGNISFQPSLPSRKIVVYLTFVA